MTPVGSPFGGALPTLVAVAVLATWFVSEAYFRRRARRAAGASPAGRSRDRGSFYIVFAGVFVTIFVSDGLWLNHVGQSPFPTFWIGVGVMLLGIGIRSWAIDALGRFFSLVVRVRDDHEIVEQGPYRWIRHPAYTGALLMLVGYPILLGNALGVLVVGVVLGATFGYRIHVEERALEERFGEAYRAYERRTWRLIPPIV